MIMEREEEQYHVQFYLKNDSMFNIIYLLWVF